MFLWFYISLAFGSWSMKPQIRKGTVTLNLPFFLNYLPWNFKNMVWFDFSFMALQHISGHFGCGQLPYPHSSWANLLGSLPVLSAHSFASNWQLPFLNKGKRENGRRNFFHDQVSTKECAGRGDRTRGRLHAKRTCFRSSYRTRH